MSFDINFVETFKDYYKLKNDLVKHLVPYIQDRNRLLVSHLRCHKMYIYLIRLLLFIQESLHLIDKNTFNSHIIEIANKITMTINETGYIDESLTQDRDIIKNTINTSTQANNN